MDRSEHTLMGILDRDSMGTQPGDSWSDKVQDIDSGLINVVLKYCTPMLGAEDIFPTLFGKYGYTRSGICDGWIWNTDELKTAPLEDLWKMLAISSAYWLVHYQRWYNSK